MKRSTTSQRRDVRRMILKVCLFVRNTFMLTTKCSSRLAVGRCAPVPQTVRALIPLFRILLSTNHSGCWFSTSKYIFLASLPSSSPSATQLDYHRRTVHMAPRRGLCYLLAMQRGTCGLNNAVQCNTMPHYAKLPCVLLWSQHSWELVSPTGPVR